MNCDLASVETKECKTAELDEDCQIAVVLKEKKERNSHGDAIKFSRTLSIAVAVMQRRPSRFFFFCRHRGMSCWYR
jgi:urease accessory protein UreE